MLDRSDIIDDLPSLSKLYGPFTHKIFVNLICLHSEFADTESNHTLDVFDFL